MPRISDENRNSKAPGQGYTILGAAKETGIPEVRIRRAVRAGEVETVTLGGTVRIPGREVRRLKELYQMKKNGGPAFPVKYAHGAGYDGMSLRDWFAGLALVGMLIDEGMGDSGESIPTTCRDAYRYADEMLEEREK